ncbi:serine hydrolase domain-containing protein [Nocardioides zeae]|uniref:CubicO group peptidase (Beta-lactamase class C family) n=1 Tax=Nocardioides zeae TaxID=1457234 RepID=A0AAJ1WZY4_9ACTN|nr:serine hydrolase domain-containing protein [Nocardioides zeae]MDQ1104078.1 CubicO group peptidase (beta-lactamase class C family) [Nocardioides zeae]
MRDDAPVLAGTARALLTRVAETQVAARAPSLVAGVVRDGTLVWSGGWGEVPGPVEDTQYRIGSITKTLTAVVVLQAVRDGLLDLGGRIDEALGEPIGTYGDRTLRQLLSHTSGMQSEPAGAWWERTEGGSFADLVAANPGAGAVFPAGQQYHYTNLGFALLGEAAARVRGTDWWSLVRSAVLEPLGMARTSYGPEAPHASGASVHPYTSELVPEPATDTGAMAPAGQVWSTVTDLGRYAAFLAAGHPDVLDGRWLDLASHPVGATRASGLASAHGLGLALLAGGSGMLRGHTGSMPGFQAACFVDAPRRTGAVVLAGSTTGVPAGGLAVDLLELLHAHEPTLPTPWRAPAAVPALVRDVVGVWHWGNTPYVVRVEGAAGDEVVVRRGDAVAHRFAVRGAPGEERLVGTGGYHDGETLKVHRRPDGSVSHLVVATFVYTRTPYDPEVPVPGGHPATGT